VRIFISFLFYSYVSVGVGLDSRGHIVFSMLPPERLCVDTQVTQFTSGNRDNLEKCRRSHGNQDVEEELSSSCGKSLISNLREDTRWSSTVTAL
jgi:hypothetical protein